MSRGISPVLFRYDAVPKVDVVDILTDVTTAVATITMATTTGMYTHRK
jgi:hypothetical protein